MRTNATVNWDDVLVKPFRCNGEESWCEVTRPTKGVLRIYPETMEIELNINKGCDPYIGDILDFLLKDKDVRMLIHMYQQKGRVRPFSIRCTGGISGREDYYINFLDKSGLVIDGKHLLHISCYGKIANIKKMYIGDFVELFANFTKYSGFRLVDTSCKYEKPYFSDGEVTTKISKII